MELYIKQKIFSLTDTYTVYDVNENPVYTAGGELFTFGAKIHLYDETQQEIMKIEEKLLTFLPKYEIYSQNGLFATLNVKFSLFSKKILVESPYGEIAINGDLFDHDYSITCNGQLFGTVSKEWLTWGDVYKLSINTDNDVEFFVAMVLTIDNILSKD